ncbi:DUF1700 domain-containing protein [Parvibacter caecicola]|uniref:DUF1700 domain-containing protein n=1 Tax=Parvibacter caecicola TaxID=747645 RepID=UPI00248AD926|nr:hypothetical protein [Parvibacter caecicola]
MNSREYKEQLSALVECLPEAEREEAVGFYLEAIADRMDEGATEEEAVALAPTPAEAAKAILSEKISELKAREGEGGSASHAFDEVVFEEVAEAYDGVTNGGGAKHDPRGFFERLKSWRLSPLEWVAVVVSSPIWLSVLVAVAVVALALLIVAFALLLVVWVLVGCVWIVGGAFVLSAPVAIVFAIWGLQIGSGPYSLVNLGHALFLFGGGMWVLRGALALTRALWKWQKENVRVSLHGFGKRRARKEGAGSGVAGRASEGASSATGSSASVSGDPIAAAADDGAQPTAAAGRSGGSLFFRACLVLLLAGLVCVLAGFISSGFDWRVFLTSVYTEGKMYLGGAQVESPERLLFSPYGLFARYF